MPRHPKPSWHRGDKCYRTQIGGITKRFLGIARDDHVGIALAFEAYLEELTARSKPPEASAVDVCLAFVEANRGIKPRTVRSHRERLAVFCAYRPDGKTPIAGQTASTLESSHLKGFLRSLASAGRSPNYRAGIARSVKAAFAWAATEEAGKLIASNPFAEVRTPSVPKSAERYASRSELASFLGYAKNAANAKPGPLMRRFARRLNLMLRIAAHTGVRPGELASAWWADFNVERHTITLPPDRHKTGGKTGKPRVIYLTPILSRAIERIRQRPDPHPVAIFTHKRGKGAQSRGVDSKHGEPWGSIVRLADGRESFEPSIGPLCQAIRKMRGRAIAEGKRLASEGKPTRGLDRIEDAGPNRFVMYRLRHTYISDALMDGTASASIAEVAGTSDRMVSKEYGHLLDHHVRATADAIHRARRKPGGEATG